MEIQSYNTTEIQSHDTIEIPQLKEKLITDYSARTNTHPVNRHRTLGILNCG